MRASRGAHAGDRGLLRLATVRHTQGVDLSKQLRLPRWVDGVLDNDRVACTLHVVLGSVLAWSGAAPLTAGLEWLKAAAHTRTEHAFERVVEGLRATRARSRDVNLNEALRSAVVRASTCCGRDARMRRRQLAALERAGMGTGEQDDAAWPGLCPRCGASAKGEVSDDR